MFEPHPFFRPASSQLPWVNGNIDGGVTIKRLRDVLQEIRWLDGVAWKAALESAWMDATVRHWIVAVSTCACVCLCMRACVCVCVLVFFLFVLLARLPRLVCARTVASPWLLA